MLRRRQAAAGQGKPRRDRPRRDRGPGSPGAAGGPRQQQQRATGPLPFQELRDAATAVVDLFGARQALRDAFAALGEKERRDLSRLVAEDGDWRVRARNIAAGSLGAGRVGKALAAQQISMARVEDLWPLTLSREEAAERQSRVRSARQRDERRAKRDSEREQRSDRVSRADLEKAQDGRVGAQIRIVIGGQPRDRKRKGERRAQGRAQEGLRRPRPPRVLSRPRRCAGARSPRRAPSSLTLEGVAQSRRLGAAHGVRTGQRCRRLAASLGPRERTAVHEDDARWRAPTGTAFPR